MGLLLYPRYCVVANVAKRATGEGALPIVENAPPTYALHDVELLGRSKLFAAVKVRLA